MAPAEPADSAVLRQLRALLAGSALLRALLILWGAMQDALMRVPYTDVDYKVFTDAARAVVRGGSPFDRATFRYTPLLAYAVLPNVLLTPLWGKVCGIGSSGGRAGQLRPAWQQQRPEMLDDYARGCV
jgi:hypothetical protein